MIFYTFDSCKTCFLRFFIEAVNNNNGTVTYTYALGGFAQPDISRFALELSANCTATLGCVTNVQSNVSVGTVEGTG
jgi:hypothetical protein